MNAKVRRIKKKYTRVHFDGKDYHAHLTIGVQSFEFARTGTKKQANWFCNMMAIALSNLIEAEKGAK